MKHPEILDFFPPDTGLETIMKVWKDNPDLYQFIQALDAYIDHLEKDLSVTEKLLQERQKLLDAIPECSEHGKCVPHALEWIKAITSDKAKNLFIKKDELLEVKTSHGILTFKKVKHIRSNEFWIKLNKKPAQ